ncbi:uncharacterized protein LOC144637528 isoform X6 [Oculina patagonica]
MSGLSKGFPDPSIASTSQEGQAGAETRTLRVTLLSSEWRSSTNGDVSTINRELSIQLAKHPNVQVSVFLPQCSEEDKNNAASHKVQLIEAEKMPGVDPVDWLINIPENHAMDCIIGHGVHLGRQIPIIKRQRHHCKWIQVVHTAPEELGMYKSITEGEQMQQTEIKLCELADQVVAVGPKLADAYKRYLCSGKKHQDVLNLTPSIFTEFLEVKQATKERKTFCVLVIGSGDCEDFNLKGYDLAAQAIAELDDKSYKLRFICAPAVKGGETAEKLLQHGIARNQLIVRSFKESREVLARLFFEVDLVIMPSRTEGFGLTALEALSAGLPVLVSGNTGLGEALKEVPNGSQCVVDSDHHEIWARKIKAVRQKSREVRLAESKLLREKYLEKYSWQESCGLLLEKMQDIVFGLSQNRPTLTKKDKRPLSLFGTQPSKRLREELTDPDPHEGFPGFLPPSVELSQLPSTVASQIQEGHNYQRSHIQSFSGHGRLPSSVEHSQLPFTAAAVPQMYQNMFTSVGQSQMPFPSATQTHGEPTFWRSHHPQGPSGNGWHPVECNQLFFPVATQTYGETTFQGTHTQMQGSFGYGLRPPAVISSQLPLAASNQTHEEPHYPRSHISGSFGWPPSSMRHNQLPRAADNPTHEEPTFLGSHHTQKDSPGFGQLPSSVEYSQLHFPVTSHQESQTQSGGLAVVVRILKAEYNRRSQLKPLFWENTIQLPLEEVYTRLKIVSRRKRDFRLENNEVNMYDIFKDNNDVTALVEGSPGIGKTTFCLKIAHDWAKEQIPKEYSFPEFEVVLLLKCRDIDGDILEAIDEQLLPERMEETAKKELMDYIQDFHYQEKVLIILDGLDELPKKSESHVDRLLHKKILPFCYVLVTSRQERGIVVRQKVDFDILLQIEGFTEEDAFDYIRKHFRNAGPEHLPTGERLIKEIQENDFLDALLNNALNLLLLCVVFEDYQGELPSFRTELYQIIVRCLLRRYCAKHSLEAPDDDKDLEKHFEDSLLALGELAWRCLQEDRFSFREEELARFERNIKDLAARKLGLVFKEASLKRINPQHEYHFFHKTFQEYLAALYLAHKILKEQLNVFREYGLNFYNNIVYNYRQVFLFLSGILAEDASVLFGQIGTMLQSKHWDWNECIKQEATFFTESFNESKNAEQVAMTLCSFIPFPLTLDLVYSDETYPVFLTVVNACKSFRQLQHPLHLTATIKEDAQLTDSNSVVDFLASWPHLRTLSFSIGFLLVSDLADSLFTALSKNLTLTSITDQLLKGIIDSSGRPDVTLAASKTATTVTFKVFFEQNEACPITLTELSPDTPLTSVVLKIYGLAASNTAMRTLKNVLSNKYITSLDLTMYGEMTDSQAAAVGEGLAAQATLKSLTLIVCGKLSYNGAVSLKKGLLENTSLNSLEVKVFGELPDNWGTVAENLLIAKKQIMSVTVHPNVIGNITNTQVANLCPVLKGNNLNLKLQSLTLHLWGELSCSGAETLCKLLMESSTSCVTLNIHGNVSDDVADCFLRHFKLCKTLSSLIINIWGELTRDGSSALQELSGNQRCSFALIAPSSTSDDRICKDLNYSTTDVSPSLISVLTKLNDTSKSKLSLNISPDDVSGDWARVLGDGLAKNTSLTTLSVTLNMCSDLSGVWACDLGNGLAKNTSLTTLCLTFNGCSYMSGDWGRGLGNGLTKNTSLTTLCLTLDSYSDTSGDWGRGLGDGLALNTSLTTLSVTFYPWVGMSGDWGLGLGDVLAKNTSLTTLSLTFNGCSYMSGDWGRGLGDGLAKNTSLTTLSLTFDTWVGMSGDWGRGLGDGLAENTSLTTLSLTFSSWNDMSGDWGLGLGDGLAKNTSLTTLSVTFSSWNDMSGDWGRGLGDGLTKNTSLTTLCLTLDSYSDTSGDWGRGLGDGLAKNTSLTTLSVTFYPWVGMSGDWGRGLGDGLAENTSLTTLSLTFSSWNDMSGDWGLGLGDGLAKNTSLTTLSLTFDSCSDMSGDWGLGLDNSLAKNTSLTTLCLTYNSCSDMSGDWGLGLGSGLANNNSLTTLCLTFDSCTDMGRDWELTLCCGLAKNTSLNTLNLTFDSCSDMSGDWARCVGASLAKNTSLTTLSLTLNNYGGTTEDWVRGLGDGLAKNTSLTTLSLTFNIYSDISEHWGLGLADGLVKNASLTTLGLTLNNYGGMSGNWLNNLCDSLAKSDTIASLSLTINDHSDPSKLLGCDFSKRLLTSLNLTVSLHGEPIVC